MISSAFNMSTTSASQVTAAVSPSPIDTAPVVLGGGFRLPSVTTAPIANKSSLTIGGGFRMPAERIAPVINRPSISVGGGFRMTKAKQSA